MSAGDAVRTAASGAVEMAKDGADSRPLNWAARLGLTARGLVYLLLGLLAVLVARGARAEVDQKGVLEQLIARPFGGSWSRRWRSASPATRSGACPRRSSA